MAYGLGRRVTHLIGAAALVLGLGVAGVPANAAGAPESMASDLAAINNGGRLYDDWMRALGEAPPRGPHPAYPAEGPLAAQPAQTWRCVACHAWDDQGTAGMPGIATMAGKPVDEIMAVFDNPNHALYEPLLPPLARADLAAFIARGQIAPGAVEAAKGDPVAPPQQLYATVCSNCHGGTGQAMPGIPALGDLARDEPALVIHKTLNGHPGEVMPALRAFGLPTMAGLLDHLRGLPRGDDMAAVVRGGRLYDNWIKAEHLSAPEVAAPGFEGDYARQVGAAHTWRCAACHGWDYRGADGLAARTTGVPTPGPGLRHLDGAPIETVLAALRRPPHEALRRLPVPAWYDVAQFVAAGQVDTDDFIDPETLKFRGDGLAHRPYYETVCAPCHGAKGFDIRTIRPLGQLAVTDPWQALHETLNGHPGEEMPALHALPSDLVAGILAYVQTLPEQRR